MALIDQEREKRLELLSIIRANGWTHVEPARLRELGIYGGAQGIWVDKARTSLATGKPDGVTVAILHTGRHYPDDLSEDGVLYHYPVTGRRPGRDEAEIQATKNAMQLDLPIFVILPGEHSKARRSVKLGWVKDFDDDSGQFFILFGNTSPEYSRPSSVDEPFLLEEERKTRTSTILTRVGQQKFRFQILAQYGPKCAVCDIRHPILLKAAHIRGKRERGSDDWRNGIPLCATHHDAFDAHLFAINPISGEIACRPDVEPAQIGLHERTIAVLKSSPHDDALAWRWRETRRAWRASEVEEDI